MKEAQQLIHGLISAHRTYTEGVPKEYRIYTEGVIVYWISTGRVLKGEKVPLVHKVVHFLERSLEKVYRHVTQTKMGTF
jgi:hypothetical protein